MMITANEQYRAAGRIDRRRNANGVPKQDVEAAGEWRIRELYDTLLC